MITPLARIVKGLGKLGTGLGAGTVGGLAVGAGSTIASAVGGLLTGSSEQAPQYAGDQPAGMDGSAGGVDGDGINVARRVFAEPVVEEAPDPTPTLEEMSSKLDVVAVSVQRVENAILAQTEQQQANMKAATRAQREATLERGSTTTPGVEVQSTKTNAGLFGLIAAAGGGAILAAQGISDYFGGDESSGLSEDSKVPAADGINADSSKPARTSPNINTAPLKTPDTSDSGGFVTPLRNTANVTSRYGRRGEEFHGGIDLDGEEGDPVVSTKAGVVSDTGFTNANGNYVFIVHPNLSNPKWKTGYLHLKNRSITVSRDQTVSQGQKIGEVGNTGRSDGSHLHLIVWEWKDGKWNRRNPQEVMPNLRSRVVKPTEYITAPQPDTAPGAAPEPQQQDTSILEKGADVVSTVVDTVADYVGGFGTGSPLGVDAVPNAQENIVPGDTGGGEPLRAVAPTVGGFSLSAVSPISKAASQSVTPTNTYVNTSFNNVSRAANDETYARNLNNELRQRLSIVKRMPKEQQARVLKPMIGNFVNALPGTVKTKVLTSVASWIKRIPGTGKLAAIGITGVLLAAFIGWANEDQLLSLGDSIVTATDAVLGSALPEEAPTESSLEIPSSGESTVNTPEATPTPGSAPGAVPVVADMSVPTGIPAAPIEEPKTVNGFKVQPADQEIKVKPYDQEIKVQPADQEIKVKPYDQEIKVKPVDQSFKVKPYDQEIKVKPVDQSFKVKPYDQDIKVKPYDQDIKVKPISAPDVVPGIKQAQGQIETVPTVQPDTDIATNTVSPTIGNLLFGSNPPGDNKIGVPVIGPDVFQARTKATSESPKMVRIDTVAPGLTFRKDETSPNDKGISTGNMSSVEPAPIRILSQSSKISPDAQGTSTGNMTDIEPAPISLLPSSNETGLQLDKDSRVQAARMRTVSLAEGELAKDIPLYNERQGSAREIMSGSPGPGYTDVPQVSAFDTIKEFQLYFVGVSP